jgi:hypothetical protein
MSGSTLRSGIGIPTVLAGVISVMIPTAAQTAETDRAFHAQICMAVPCAGTFGQLQLFRDKRGRLARILARGDFRVCSHPPAVYYDAQGKTLESIDDWLRVDKERASAAEEFHTLMTAGLQRAEVISCSDVCKTPSRPDPNDTKCLPP